MAKMDTEVVAIQRVRAVLAQQKLNRDQQLRVLNFVSEGIYRQAQEHQLAQGALPLGNQLATASVGTPQSSGPYGG